MDVFSYAGDPFRNFKHVSRISRSIFPLTAPPFFGPVPRVICAGPAKREFSLTPPKSRHKMFSDFVVFFFFTRVLV